MHEHRAELNRAFALGIAFNLVYVVVEAVYGVLADSLALLADAGHNASDVLSLILAWTAVWLAGRPPSRRRTYGLGRSTILASLVNAVILLMAVGVIFWEALQRFNNPAPVAAQTMLWVAVVGLFVNAGAAALFIKGSREDLNVRGAFLHMAADAGVTLGVVVAALVIRATGWAWVDPAMSMVIVLVIAVGAWGLLRESMNLAMDAVPRSIDPAEVAALLRSTEGVSDLHDLHIWALSTTRVALTCHLVVETPRSDAFLRELSRELHERFGIDHATIQLESGDGDCAHEACEMPAGH
jgi:cobalt-zinc-cadmium efflux system protein